MSKRFRDVIRNAMDAGLGIVLLKFLVGLVIVLGLTGHLKSVLRPVQALLGGGAQTTQQGAAMPQKSIRVGASNTRSATAEDVRESKRKADEVRAILESSTPEM